LVRFQQHLAANHDLTTVVQVNKRPPNGGLFSVLLTLIHHTIYHARQ
jgi:hypothetical protein